MSPRPKLTLLGAALVASLGVAMPVSAEDRDGTAPALDRVAPGADSQNRRLKDAPQPADEPQEPVPGGCPLREGKLELIA